MTTVGVWYDCRTASTWVSQYAAPSVNPLRLPSFWNSYSIGCRENRQAPQTAPAITTSEVTITRPG